ncbi:MAG TPA: choice-of-anchor Q domain-containing protein, partial [Herpetosiphonaceae bacterium]
ATCRLTGPGDQPRVANVLAGPLADNGGPTWTHALLPGSPALNAGGMSCPGVDQRGVSRPQGAACEIGAFELEEADPIRKLFFPLISRN